MKEGLRSELLDGLRRQIKLNTGLDDDIIGNGIGNRARVGNGHACLL